MSNQRIECDFEVTLNCINDLKSLYDELNGINIQNTGMISTGLCASEVQNTVQALLKYKEMLANLIEQSCNFTNTYYNNAKAADKSSSVTGSSQNNSSQNNSSQNNSSQNNSSSSYTKTGEKNPLSGNSQTTNCSDIESYFDYEWFGGEIDDEFKRKVVEISEKLECDPDDLMAIMAFESGFRTDIRNGAGSGATGLIQFMPSTACSLGTTTDELAEMSAVEQLDYVYMYLKPYKSKLNSIEDMYMAVLWPKACGKDSDYVLFSEGGKYYAQNRGLDLNNNGQITKGEAAQRVINKMNTYKKKS